MEQKKTESHSDQMIDKMNDEKKLQVITLKEATEILKLHNEWRRGAEIGMGNVTRLGEAIDFITQYYKENEGNDTLNNNLTKPNFVARREQLAWDIIEEKLDSVNIEYLDLYKDGTFCSSQIIKYLKTICHPPMLKNNNEGL
jgi:hypothetical protein